MEDEIKAAHPDAAVTLIKGSGGIFDIHKDGELVYSKGQTGRFPDDGEINKILAG